MARVCVVGSINTDLTFTVDVPPRPGETVLAASLTMAAGGKGANQAVAAARAGAAVQFVGAVGGDAAADGLLAHLRANNVGVDGVVRLPGASGTAVVVVDSGAENTIVVAPGANGHLTIDSATARGLIAESDVLLLQLEIPVATAVAAARVARRAGAAVIVNASPMTADCNDLAAQADVVVLNETEAQQWHWPTPHLVITRGARGASYVGADGSLDIAAPVVEAVDTTGAGDVFAGVLATAWTGDRDCALRRACAAAALATLVYGAGDCAPRTEAIDEAVLSR